MQIRLALPLVVLVAALLFSIPSYALPIIENQTINASTHDVGAGLMISVDTLGNTTHGTTDCFLSVRTRDAYVNLTNTSGAYATGLNLTAGTTVNLNWSSGTNCGRTVSFLVYCNRTGIDVNTSTAVTSNPEPRFNGSATMLANISTFTCANTTHMVLTLNGTTTGLIQTITNHTMVIANKTCPMLCLNCDNITNYNTSTDCYSKIYITAQPAGTNITVYTSAAVSFAAPPNLPVAISAATIVASIIIISVAVVKKRAGWT